MRIYLLLTFFYFLYVRWLYLPAAWAFAAWILLQIGIAFLQTHAAGDVSGLAHVGGAAVGLVAWALRRFVLGEPDRGEAPVSVK